MASLLDGREVAAAIQQQVAEDIASLRQSADVTPRLAVVLNGEDSASQAYVGRKRQAAKTLGIETRDHIFPGGLSEQETLALVRELNDDKSVHGILVQRPLPKGVSEERTLESIDPAKDVDGFHPENLGRLMIGKPTMVPCTPAGILAILDHYKVDLSGRIAAVVGRSRIVGKPVAQLLLARDATVLMAHSRTANLVAITRQADVLIVATGRAGLIRAKHVKSGAVVIDVGVNRLPDGSLTGDVDFAGAAQVSSAITPVPGGVGPTTVAMLMRNTVLACRRQVCAPA